MRRYIIDILYFLILWEILIKFYLLDIFIYLYNSTNKLLFIIIVQIVHSIVFFGINIFFLRLDIYSKPSFLLKYKIQKTKNNPIKISLLKEILPLILLNHLLIGPIIFYFANFYFSTSNEIYSIVKELEHYIVFILVEELMFYYIHRVCHYGIIYKYIHKIHHKLTAPIGISALYSHPVEHILINILPIITGPIIMQSPKYIILTWVTITNITAVFSHCNYHLPFMPSPEFHDYHHVSFINNFGILGILDTIHGTNDIFKKTENYKRNEILFKLK